MEVLLRLSVLFVDMVIPWILGYAAAQTRYRSERMCNFLLNANIIIFWPLMGILSMWSIRLEKSLLLLVVLGMIHYAVPGILGWFECRRKFTDPLDQGSYFLMALLPNNITIGFISSFILFGETGVALTQIMTSCAMPVNFLVSYPFGQYFGNLGGVSGIPKPTIKNLLFSKNQLPTLGVILGVVLNISGIERPEIFTAVLATTVHISAWAFLYSVGHAMEFSHMKRYWKIGFEVLKYKFIVAPIAVAIFAYLFFKDTTVIGTAITISFSPIAIFAIVISQIYRLNYHMTITGMLISHVVFAAVVFPILIWAKDWLW